MKLTKVIVLSSMLVASVSCAYATPGNVAKGVISGVINPDANTIFRFMAKRLRDGKHINLAKKSALISGLSSKALLVALWCVLEAQKGADSPRLSKMRNSTRLLMGCLAYSTTVWGLTWPSRPIGLLAVLDVVSRLAYPVALARLGWQSLAMNGETALTSKRA